MHNYFFLRCLELHMTLPYAIIRYKFYYIGIVKNRQNIKPGRETEATVQIRNTERMIEK